MTERYRRNLLVNYHLSIQNIKRRLTEIKVNKLGEVLSTKTGRDFQYSLSLRSLSSHTLTVNGKAKHYAKTMVPKQETPFIESFFFPQM